MDAVYAWDQPDLYLYVPAGAYFFDPADLCFQETLGGAALLICGLRVEVTYDAAGGIGGGVPTLAEKVF